MKINKHTNQQNFGFTLVEISIVIIIISLLVAGVVAGQKLLQNAKLQAVIKEIREYDTAIKQFKDKFRYYPGDLPNAATYWDATHGNATNGNGNWQVSSTTTESLYFWKELALAGFTPSTYSGAVSTPSYQIGTNIPGSNYNNNASYFVTYHVNQFQTTGNAITLAKVNTTAPSAWNDSLILVDDAFFIDKKIDDGNAGTGNLYVPDGNDGVTAGSCSASSAGAPANYNLTTKIAACRLFWWLDKNK